MHIAQYYRSAPGRGRGTPNAIAGAVLSYAPQFCGSLFSHTHYSAANWNIQTSGGVFFVHGFFGCRATYVRESDCIGGDIDSGMARLRRGYAGSFSGASGQMDSAVSAVGQHRSRRPRRRPEVV
jgi:hypothetical protein